MSRSLPSIRPRRRLAALAAALALVAAAGCGDESSPEAG
jgi:hypothetical protein